MRDRSVLKALLWKDYRFLRMFLLFFVFIPPLSLGAASAFDKFSAARAILTMLGTVMVMPLFAVWGAMNRIYEKKAGDFTDAHLPVAPIVRWVVSLALPLLIAMVLGAWVGLWTTAAEHWQNAGIQMVQISLVCSLIYAFSYFVSGVSRWPWIGIGFGFQFIAMATFAYRTSASLDDIHRHMVIVIQNLGIGLVCTVIGSFLFDCVLLKRPLLARRLISISVIPAAILLIMWNVGGIRSGINWNAYSEYNAPRIDSRDWSMHVSRYSTKEGGVITYNPMTQGELEFADDRNQLRVTRVFENATAPVDFLSNDRAILLQQLPNDKGIRVLIWDARHNTVQTKVMFRADRYALEKSGDIVPDPDVRTPMAPVGFASPDGRFLLTAIGNRFGHGRDLWLIDLRNGHSTLLRKNGTFAADAAQWTRDVAFLSGQGKPLTVDLNAGTARLYELPTRGRK